MRAVSKEEFYEAIYSGRLNVHPTIVGNFPYTSIWKHLGHGNYGQVFGKSVDVYENGRCGLTTTEYYIA